MVASIAVVAPHPDDETLGAGASLLRHVSRGDEIHWIIATRIPSGTDFGGVDAGARQREIDTIAQVSSRLVVNPARLKLDGDRIGALIDALERVVHG